MKIKFVCFSGASAAEAARKQHDQQAAKNESNETRCVILLLVGYQQKRTRVWDEEPSPITMMRSVQPMDTKKQQVKAKYGSQSKNSQTAECLGSYSHHRATK